MDDEIPSRVADVLKKYKHDIVINDYKNIGYRGKVYTIHNSVNVGLYATFTAYKKIEYDYNTPLLYTEVI